MKTEEELNQLKTEFIRELRLLMNKHGIDNLEIRDQYSGGEWEGEHSSMVLISWQRQDIDNTKDFFEIDLGYTI